MDKIIQIYPKFVKTSDVILEKNKQESISKCILVRLLLLFFKSYDMTEDITVFTDHEKSLPIFIFM